MVWRSERSIEKKNQKVIFFIIFFTNSWFERLLQRAKRARIDDRALLAGSQSFRGLEYSGSRDSSPSARVPTASEARVALAQPGQHTRIACSWKRGRSNYSRYTFKIFYNFKVLSHPRIYIIMYWFV